MLSTSPTTPPRAATPLRLRARARAVRAASASGRRAFTLVELLVVIAILGIASAVLIPSLDSVGSLRVQTAIRTIVSDITFAQSDAIAFQQRRQVLFDPQDNSYRLIQVLGARADARTSTMYNPDLPGGQYIQRLGTEHFGGVRITSVEFNGSSSDHALTFDEMGMPLAGVSSTEAGTGGTVRLEVPGPGGIPRSVHDIIVDAFTGRVTVREVQR